MSDSIGSVSVEIVPNARGFAEKLRAEIRDLTVQVQAEADTGAANAKLDEAARTRTAKIKVEVDRSAFDRAATSFSGFLGGLGLIPTLAIPATAALIPLVGVLGGLAAALAAPLVIAGGAATLFGFLAAKAVTQTNKQLKLISSTQTALDKLTKGTAAYSAKAAELKSLQNGLSDSAVKYQSSLAKVKGAFDQLLQGKTGDALLGTVARGLDLLAKILPGLAPLVQAVGKAFSTLIGDVSKAASGPGFNHFIDLIARKAGPDIVKFGRIAGNAVKGFTGLLLGLDHAFGSGVLNGLLDLSRNFAKLGQSSTHSKVLQQFADYFHKNGPGVAKTLGSVAVALGHIVAALSPLGPASLGVIRGIADAISAIPIPVLTALAGAFVAMTAVAKISKPLGAIGGLARKVLTGGGGPLGGGGILGSAKPVPVYVTNPGFGGPGGSGGPGGLLGKIGKYAGPGTVAGAGIGIAGTAAVAVGTVYLTAKVIQAESKGGAVPLPGIKADRQFAAANGFGAIKGYINDISPDIIATTTHLQGLRANAAKATQQLDLIGPHTRASAAVATAAIDAVQRAENALHDKKFRIVAETQGVIAALNAIRSYTIPDKNFNVIAHSQHADLAYGPGGGVGHPGAQPSAGSGGGGAGITVNVTGHIDEKGYVTGTAQDVYSANQRFEGIRAGR